MVSFIFRWCISYHYHAGGIAGRPMVGRNNEQQTNLPSNRSDVSRQTQPVRIPPRGSEESIACAHLPPLPPCGRLGSILSACDLARPPPHPPDIGFPMPTMSNSILLRTSSPAAPLGPTPCCVREGKGPTHAATRATGSTAAETESGGLGRRYSDVARQSRSSSSLEGSCEGCWA